MRITRYRFPKEMSIRDCYEAWTKDDPDRDPFCEGWAVDYCKLLKA